MRFPYTEVEVSIQPAFPTDTAVLRPHLTVYLQNGDVRLGTIALVDSGADHCLFPSSLAAELDIEVPNIRRSAFAGTSGTTQHAYFDVVQITVLDPRTHEDAFTFTADVGFCEDLDTDGIGYLGLQGFFSIFEVAFNFPEYYFEISSRLPRPVLVP